MPETGEKEGEMPKEEIYATAVTDQPDTEQPYLTIAWGRNADMTKQVTVNGHVLSDDQLDHLVRVFKRAQRWKRGGETFIERRTVPDGDWESSLDRE